MAWSQTDTGIQYKNGESLTRPTFSSTESVLALEREQWTFAKQAAELLIKHKAVGTAGSTTATYTVTLSGTSVAGHPNNDTVTVTVTAIAQ